jgi:hypothetical protein
MPKIKKLEEANKDKLKVEVVLKQAERSYRENEKMSSIPTGTELAASIHARKGFRSIRRFLRSARMAVSRTGSGSDRSGRNFVMNPSLSLRF